MFTLFSKALAFLWRRAEEGGGEKRRCTDGPDLKYISGVVTRFCNDYGMIDDQMCFTSELVMSGAPLYVGEKVNALVEEDLKSGGWKVVRVEKVDFKWENENSSSEVPTLFDENVKDLIGNITSCTETGGYINQTTHYSISVVSEGYDPFKGDWVQAQYFINSATWRSEACFVKPLRYKKVDKVKISMFFGRSGVIDESIYFTMESLILPRGYSPQRGDLVSVVVVESNQSCYTWRALCIAPVNKNGLLTSVEGNPSEQCMSVLLRNKGGLEISNKTHFGAVKLGTSNSLTISIVNHGSTAQSLISCKFASSDKANPFRFKCPREDEKHNGAHSVDMTEDSSYTNGFGTSQCYGDPSNSPSNNLLHSGSKSLCLIFPFASRRPTIYPLRFGHYTPNMPLLRTPPSLSDQRENASRLQPTTESVYSDCPQEENHQEYRQSSVPVHDGGQVDILPEGSTSIEIICESRNLGHCKELLLFCFSDFIIGRFIEVEVVSEEESLISATNKFQFKRFPRYKVPEITSSKVSLSVSLTAPRKRNMRRQLPNFIPSYPIPDQLKKCVEKKMDILIFEPCLAELLYITNYKKTFSTLLWLEELQAETEIRELSMSSIPLKKNGSFLVLEVPGVTDGRPSLYPGDRIILKHQEYTETVVEYVCFVNEIHDDEVTLKVNSALEQSYNFEPMDVEFCNNRTTHRRCHYAVEQGSHLGKLVLFPDSVVLQTPLVFNSFMELNGSTDNRTLYESQKVQNNITEDEHIQGELATVNNTTSGPDVSFPKQTNENDTHSTKNQFKKNESTFFNSVLNEHQKLAVKRILGADCRPTPYVLFGPPGTGKTVTVIEAILQIHYSLSDSRILVCAPSNSATDLLCLRLHESQKLGAGDMVRVNASSRNEETLSDIIRIYSGDGEDMWKASRFRIIICTCSSAGMFYQIGLRIGHFTHLFVDEAGQASEPECLIPLGLMSEISGQVVLSGDPLQLGPVIKSRLSMTFGLGVSLIERLMSRPLYSRDEKSYGAFGSYNPMVITKLLKNYRSHPALLELPSRLFYHKELQVCADTAVVNSLSTWNKLPRKHFPLIFHGVRGTETREGYSPSWFNPTEAVQVMRYCCILANHVSTSVSARNIGVITPYRKQVEKIRILLQSVDLSEVKVGSVEEFQGQEYLVIIISTVRSSDGPFNEDAKVLLGFLTNPKRFNVAITRSKALLIVVGNPHVLVKDPCFSALLEYSLTNGVYIGCNLPPGLEALRHCD